MIASPGDVAAEREICREVINEWNIINSELRKIVLLPVMWERNTRPEMGGRGQAIVNRQILHKADLLIGIFWKKIGTPTGQSISGTVEEIEEHIEEGKPAMLYFSDKPVPPSEFNNEQYQAVKKLQTDYFDSGLIGGFNGDEDFRMKLKNHLALTINNSQYFIPEAERSIFESFEQQTNEEKFSTRKKILTTEIPVSGDSIELRFYDNAEIDGDSIALFLNDKMIFEHIRLLGSAYTIKLAVKDLNATNELIMVAENLGSIPPNTSYMVVLVGDKRYSARLESTEGSSAMVRFVKKSGSQ